MNFSEQELNFLIRAVVKNYAEDFEDFETPDITDIGVVGTLIPKLIWNHKNGYNIFLKSRKEKTLNKPIKEKLFMGSGYHSTVRKNNLHKRLEFAIHELGGMEQNGGMGTSFDEVFDAEGKQNIKEVVQDIMIAFGLTIEDLKWLNEAASK